MEPAVLVPVKGNTFYVKQNYAPQPKPRYSIDGSKFGDENRKIWLDFTTDQIEAQHAKFNERRKAPYKSIFFSEPSSYFCKGGYKLSSDEEEYAKYLDKRRHLEERCQIERANNYINDNDDGDSKKHSYNFEPYQEHLVPKKNQFLHYTELKELESNLRIEQIAKYAEEARRQSNDSESLIKHYINEAKLIKDKIEKEKNEILSAKKKWPRTINVAEIIHSAKADSRAVGNSSNTADSCINTKAANRENLYNNEAAGKNVEDDGYSDLDLSSNSLATNVYKDQDICDRYPEVRAAETINAFDDKNVMPGESFLKSSGVSVKTTSSSSSSNASASLQLEKNFQQDLKIAGYNDNIKNYEIKMEERVEANTEDEEAKNFELAKEIARNVLTRNGEPIYRSSSPQAAFREIGENRVAPPSVPAQQTANIAEGYHKEFLKSMLVYEHARQKELDLARASHFSSILEAEQEKFKYKEQTYKSTINSLIQRLAILEKEKQASFLTNIIMQAQPPKSATATAPDDTATYKATHSTSKDSGKTITDQKSGGSASGNPSYSSSGSTTSNLFSSYGSNGGSSSSNSAESGRDSYRQKKNVFVTPKIFNASASSAHQTPVLPTPYGQN